MTRRCTLPIEITATAIDGNGHVNNVEYVRWMQDAAIAHANAVGCSAAAQAAGCTWVVRTHKIEYLRPALLGDRLEVHTWVASFRRASSLRRYEFHRQPDGLLLAQGETDWVYVDATTGRPQRIPGTFQTMFDLPDRARSSPAGEGDPT